MGFNRLKRLYYTLSYLKLTQVYYQIKYRLVQPRRVDAHRKGNFIQVELSDFPRKDKSLLANGNIWSFRFLNLEHDFFLDRLNWSFQDYGLLWTYNLNYFEWLHQENMSKELGLETLSRFYTVPVENNSLILHPYPTSLRIMNIAKFISKWDIKQNWLYSYLVSDLMFLSGRLEYHILANHLLENAFAMYIGGLVTNQKEFHRMGKELLIRELEEQILNDGMHYERSPMYHLIILERLLDALNFANAIDNEFVAILKYYAVKMTGLVLNWKDLDRIPMMQDSAYGIALSIPAILDYSKSLLEYDYPVKPNVFQDSGYGCLNSGDLKLIANIGSISPAYQPAHAHSDELSFELFNSKRPFIVDTGVSTYEKDEIRFNERSSFSHNCVSIKNQNLSDVSAGFRVGKRATVKSNLGFDFIKATCKSDRIEVTRKFKITSEGLLLEDRVVTKNYKSALGCLHLHPDVELEKLNSCTFKASDILISIFTDNNEISIEDYFYSQGFNNRIPAKKLVYSIKRFAKVEFKKT